MRTLSLIITSGTEKYWGMAILWIIAFFTPIQGFILATGIFVVCDLITGVIAANKKGEKVESKKLFRSVAKFLVYGVAIIISHIISVLYIQNFPAEQLIAGFIAFVEVKSIDENIQIVTGYSILGGIVSKLKAKK